MSTTSYPSTPRLLKRIFERIERIRRNEEKHAKQFPSKAEKAAKLQQEMQRQNERA